MFRCRVFLIAFVLVGSLLAGGPIAFSRAASPATSVGTPLDQWSTALDAQVLDYYEDSGSITAPLPPGADITASWSPAAKAVLASEAPSENYPFAVGRLRARVQQAIAIEMAAAIRAGDIERAKSLRAELTLPRGVSATEGGLLLQSLSNGGNVTRDDAVKVLTREAITWQTSRVRQLLDDSFRSTQANTPLPGRLMERLGEAMTLADLPAATRTDAQLESLTSAPAYDVPLASLGKLLWDQTTPAVESLRNDIQSRLPSLLSDNEKERMQRLLLKLVELIPKEYQSGVRDHAITVPLEYREAVTFTQQARQIVGELAPLWLADKKTSLAKPMSQLDDLLDQADKQIAAVATADDLQATLDKADKLLQGPFGISLHLNGTTADIVDEVMAETKSTLLQSLSAGLAGNFTEAERLRVEAYTTYDPDLEARLLPRDPALAMNIERLLLDGVDHPGVKVMLDRHAGGDDLTAAYSAVNDALDRATAMLKSSISPTAAAMNAGSIVLREGLEGLLVTIAILAGLRGSENAGRRRWYWIGILVSIVASLVTWLLSQTLITSLRNYGEVIEAVTGLLAIGVLLLITNWLFHQVYWKQWVTTLKAQAGQDSSAWSLMTVGFLVGYREGFETVLFLQSLALEAGGKSVGIGVLTGAVILFGLGFAALRVGMKLPYMKILLLTALFIGVVLITFVGGTMRSAQTVGWMPVHRLTDSSWPLWMGNWLGLYNTWESLLAQGVTVLTVIGTWRVARWRAKRKASKRRISLQMAPMVHAAPSADCDPENCAFADTPVCDHETAPAALPLAGANRVATVVHRDAAEPARV